MKKIFLSIVSLLVIAGCGGGGAIRTAGTDADRVHAVGDYVNERAPKQPTVDVKYTLNGTKRPTCHNADDIGNIAPDNSDFVKCAWFCGRYNGVSSRGSDTITVFLTFRKSERTDQGVWELSKESLTEADAIVCKDI